MKIHPARGFIVELNAKERKLLATAQLMLKKSAEKGATMDTKKLMILMYLADVASFRVLGKPITGYNWKKTEDGVEVGSIWRPLKRMKSRG